MFLVMNVRFVVRLSFSDETSARIEYLVNAAKRILQEVAVIDFNSAA